MIASSRRRLSSTRATTDTTRSSARFITSFRSAYAISGSPIQNSVRGRRAFDFSVRAGREALAVDRVAARSARGCAGRPRDGEGGFLRQVVGRLEQLLADRRLRHDALDEAGTVAENEEMDFSARAAVVQPPFDGDLL